MMKIALLLAGMIVGATVSLIGVAPRLQPGRATVLECRRRLDAIDAWSPSDKARFWAIVRSDPVTEERWRVIREIAGIPLD